MPIEDAVLFELHKLCATFSASVNINYRLPIKVYYCICTLNKGSDMLEFLAEMIIKVYVPIILTFYSADS
jgi:hypothetical protein